MHPLSSNNYGPIPNDLAGTETNNIYSHNYVQDPTYYYPDGNAAFLVEGILFKLHASLILPLDSVATRSTDDNRRYPTGVDNLPRRITDSDDINPIILTNVTASQFRNYLFALLGSPSDPLYLALLTDAKDTSKHDRDLLVRYLDISCIARQFGKSELEEWARSQLRLVLESMYHLATSGWDKDTLLRLNSYARSTGIEGLISSTRTFIEYFISISSDRKPSGQEPISSNLDTCVQMYKDPNLPNDDPALFGCVFASILSLGHRSTTWISKMTQRERAVLYAAQVQFTSVVDEMESVEWLRHAALSLPFLEEVCPECQSQLEYLWLISFSQCVGRGSADTSQNVTALARLPQHRRAWVSRWNPPDACTLLKIRRRPDRQPESLVSAIARVFIPFTFESTECPKLKLPLADIDRRIQLVYEELARRHEDFVLEA